MNQGGRDPKHLNGASVLVVEDEFYLAVELKEGIERAGGTVLGPCSHMEAIENEIARTTPDCAILDINLGYGASFETAEKLQQRRVPFVFLTGYDAPSIPARWAHVDRLEKPAQINQVLEAVGRLTEGRKD